MAKIQTRQKMGYTNELFSLNVLFCFCARVLRLRFRIPKIYACSTQTDMPSHGTFHVFFGLLRRGDGNFVLLVCYGVFLVDWFSRFSSAFLKNLSNKGSILSILGFDKMRRKIDMESLPRGWMDMARFGQSAV